MKLSGAEKDLSRRRALAIQWATCSAVLIGFTEVIATRVGIPNPSYACLQVFGGVNLIIGATLWHRASNAGE